MTAGLVTELGKMAALAKDSLLTEMYEAWWTLIGQGRGLRQRGIGRFFSQSRAGVTRETAVATRRGEGEGRRP